MHVAEVVGEVIDFPLSHGFSFVLHTLEHIFQTVGQRFECSDVHLTGIGVRNYSRLPSSVGDFLVEVLRHEDTVILNIFHDALDASKVVNVGLDVIPKRFHNLLTERFLDVIRF